MRRRLDAELVRRGLARSRTDAVAAIREGRVTVAGAPAGNPARLVDDAFAVHVGEPAARFVSRGGLKLDHALQVFAIDVAAQRWLDAGASTGGFTDCLLQRAVDHVVAVDVGHGQLAWSIRNDERVTVIERQNVRSLTATMIDGLVDGCCADLSFISLITVAPALARCVVPGAPLVLLIKPQFEAGRNRLGKGGVIRDIHIRSDVVAEVVSGLAEVGLGVVGLVPSPISGADGNREFLALAHHGTDRLSAAAVREIVCEDDLTEAAGADSTTVDAPTDKNEP